MPRLTSARTPGPSVHLAPEVAGLLAFLPAREQSARCLAGSQLAQE